MVKGCRNKHSDSYVDCEAQKLYHRSPRVDNNLHISHLDLALI
jgi:hypothetical protein